MFERARRELAAAAAAELSRCSAEELAEQMRDLHAIEVAAMGGPTSRWNLILICAEHHRAAHDGRFVVVFHAPGEITVRPRRSGDPHYQFEFRPPDPTSDQLHLDALLASAARHLKAAAP